MNPSVLPGGILCIAAHPDDEVLGCGGVLALHAKNGDPVTIVIVCEGESLRYGPDGVGQDSHIQRAAAKLGCSSVRHLRFPDQALDTIRLTELITPLEKIVREVRPRIVYSQHGGDVNRDHHILFQAVLVATRPTETFIETVYAFDAASSTEWAYPRTFTPDTWVDISSTLGYSDFLDQTGGGIHHVLFEVSDIDPVIQELAKSGVTVLQSGTGIRPGTRWVLLDTREMLGFYVELRHRPGESDGTSVPE